MLSKLWFSRKATNTTVDIQQPAKYANSPQTISRSSRVFGGSVPKSEHIAEHTLSSTSSPRRTFNVVLCGETGIGRSSVINLIARKEIAVVSSDVSRCTMQYECYRIPFDDMDFAIYDTFGLEEPQISVDGYLKTIQHVYGLIDKLDAAGGIHLLLFCMRGGRITATTQSNYLLFRECLCHGEVPTALVFTGLEMEVEMEDWWRRNKKDIEYYGLKSDGHACITAVRDDEDDQKFLASQARVRQLLEECAIKHDPFSLKTHTWFARFTRGMKSFIKGKKLPTKKQIMKVLMQRCKVDRETARKVVAIMENGDVETNKGDDPQERSGDDEPRKEVGLEKNPATFRSLPSERADPPAGILNNKPVPNECDEDSRGRNGGDEPEDGREAVPGEPPAEDNSPPKEHEDLQAHDEEDPAKKSIDESILNGHDQKGQQAGIKGETRAETGKILTNSDSLLDGYSTEEDWLSWKQEGSGGMTTEAATQSTKDDPLSREHEKREVQQTEPRQGHGRLKAEAALVSLPFPHPPVRKDESSSRDRQETRVAMDSTVDGSSSDEDEKPPATKVQSGEKGTSEGILMDDGPLQTQKDLLSGGVSDWQFALATDELMLNGCHQEGQQASIDGGGQTETGEISTNGDSLLDEYSTEEDRLLWKWQRSGAPVRNDALTNRVRNKSPSIDLTGRVTKSSRHPFASGGYGDIYRGIYHSDEKPIDVAIRTTRMYLHHNAQLSANMKLFRREVAVWWGLKHPNVLPFLGIIMDPSTNPDIPAMVCPFAESGPLTVYLAGKKDLASAKRLLLIDDVAHGLQYIHSQQIVHGNLSGSNVLIGGEGTACIADFGLSTLLTRLGGSTFPTNHHAKSILRWTAPELFDISDHDIIPTTQSDVYSFGCIVLQILTGNIPYHYLRNDPQVICAIVTGMKPTRPDGEVIDDNTWKFIEWCWSPVTAAEPCPRPSGDQIVAFTEMALGVPRRS